MSMKRIGFYLSYLTLTGGTKVIDQLIGHIKKLGLEPYLYTQHIETSYQFQVTPIVIDSPAYLQTQHLDIIILARLSDLESCKNASLSHLAMFFQRDEIDNLAEYYKQKKHLSKYNNPIGKIFLNAKYNFQKIKINHLYRNIKYRGTPCHIIADSFTNQHLPFSFIRNSINLDLYTSLPRVKKKIPTVLCIGDYCLGIKNVPLVYKAIANVKQKRDIHFIRITPNTVPMVEKKLGIADEILSCLDDKAMAEVYARSDILISASLSEGFGMPPVEAMASGCLCVLSNIPAHRLFNRLMENPVSPFAIYFDPNSAIDLERQILSILDSEHDLQQLVDNGREVSRCYSPSEQQKDLYDALIKITF